jgi:serine-type D-Ala-D-Ala carboxypeptidase
VIAERRLDSVRALLADGIESRAFPGAVVEAGNERGTIWRACAGRFTYEHDAPAMVDDTLFDLASLTKVIATTTLAMRLVEARRLSLADRVSAYVRAWDDPDRRHVTVRDLLEHCSGLPAWAPLYRLSTGRAQFEREIARAPLEYPPWTASVYSDLGFMLVGFVLEDAGGMPLARQFASLGSSSLMFTPDATLQSRMAPTEYDAGRGRLLRGEVHDENARALGGVAGHAGLFGNAASVGAFARLVLRTFATETALARPDTLRRFVTRSTVPGSSRALGWDTMLPTSSCGSLLSPRAIGHTGFTGTSLWIDPGRDLYIVLLTNRVHPDRENLEGLRRLRPAVHDAIVRAVS